MELAQEVLHVPNTYVGAIIGQGGSKIQELMRASQATIVIEKEKNDPRKITIHGAASAVAVAANMVNEVMDSELQRMGARSSQSHERSTPMLNSALGLTTIEVQVATKQCGVVIGRGGENIRLLQASTGARVHVTREVDGDTFRTLSITGSEAQVALVRQKLHEMGKVGDVFDESLRQAQQLHASAGGELEVQVER